jgi:hypothetical protein
MFWYLLFGVMLIVGIVLLVLGSKGVGWCLGYVGWVLIAIAILCLLSVVGQAIDNKQQVATYPQRKAFYESVTAGSEYEDATFKREKAELNDGLFEAQWYRENMPFFSLFPAEVLELEPIK